MRLRPFLSLISISFAASFLLFSCGNDRQRRLWPEFSAEEAQKPLVEYDGRTVTIGTFTEDARAAASESTVFALLTIPKLRDHLEQKYVKPDIIMADMEKRGLDRSPAVRQKILGHKHVLMAIHLFNDQIKDKYAYTREELQAAYDANKQKYRKHTRVDIRQIVTSTKQEALMLLDRVKAGEKIGDLARKYSRDSFSANRWGKTGSFPLRMGRYPDNFENVLAGMKVGELAGPVHTGAGWHIFKMIERHDGNQLTLDQSLPTIKNDLKKQKEDARLTAFTDSLKQKFPVKVVDAVYRDMRQDADLVATVGTQEVFVRDIREAARKMDYPDIPEPGADRDKIFDTVVRQKIMLAEAYDRGFDTLPQVRRILDIRTRNAMLLHFEKTDIEGRITVTDKEVREFYRNRGEKALVKYVATKEKELAYQIRDELKKGMSIKEIEAIAKTRIQVRDAAWDRNETTYRQIMEAAFALDKKHPVSEVISLRSPDDRETNYYILTFKERKTITLKPFTQEEHTIRRTIFRLKKDALRKQTYDQLYKRSHLRWHENNLKFFIDRWRAYLDSLKPAS